MSFRSSSRQRHTGSGRARARSTHRLSRMIVLVVLALCPAGLLQAQPTGHPPDTMEARLMACAACHGTQGQGTNNAYFPRLAGKPAGYLMNQLVAFRDGRRRYPPMNYLLEYIPDAYLRQMAEYFSALRPPRSNTPQIARYTGLFAGALVAIYITLESPLSGMSMNPARTFGSAFVGRLWTGLWIYFTAPVLAMQLAATFYLGGKRTVYCAKYHHYNQHRCIFNCRFPELLARERLAGGVDVQGTTQRESSSPAATVANAP